MARGAYFDPDVDPDLLRALESSGYNKHKVELFSGRAARPKNPNSLHPAGRAVDVALYDDKGRKLDNLGDASPEDIRAYQEYANAVYQWAQANDPELAHELVWGGYFKGGGWPRDRMHFQRGGVMGGGSWDQGFDPEYAKAAGVDQGGLAAMDAAMKEAGYSPEQRRNAIAAIESKGSGDYAARGPWTGDPEEGRDQALGRYQVMGRNVAPWAKQYLDMEGVTTEQFMRDPALQDKLFDAVYGDYVKKYGERGAASKWFTGSEKEPDVTDVNGKLTGKTYADRYMAALGDTHVDHPPNATVGTGDLDGPEATPAADTKTNTAGKSWWQKALGNIGDINLGGVKQPEWRASKSPAASLSASQPISMIDENSAENQRRKLAEVMAALNSGKLPGQG